MLKKHILILFISIFISCNNTKYEHIIKDENFRQSIESGNFIELSEGYTYFEVDNRTSNNVLIFIHGFSVPSYIWDKTYNSAKEKGFKVVRLDLYGRGYSDNPNVNYSDELFARQVIELLDDLEIEKASFLGLSNGGRIISKIANLKPNLIDKLIYVSASSFGEHIELEEKNVTTNEINTFITKKYPSISMGQLSDFKYPKNFPNWVKKYESLLKYKGFARALISTQKNHINLDLEHKEINESNMKVYTIWGDSDSVIVYNDIKEKLNKLLPNRFEYIIAESGHLPHIENQVDFENYLFELVLNNNYSGKRDGFFCLTRYPSFLTKSGKFNSFIINPDSFSNQSATKCLWQNLVLAQLHINIGSSPPVKKFKCSITCFELSSFSMF
jgi:pimeloyl-ACP methyl ester carboxylesterase